MQKGTETSRGTDTALPHDLQQIRRARSLRGTSFISMGQKLRKPYHIP